MEMPDDENLLKLLQDDSVEAFGQVFIKYYKPLCLQAQIILKDQVSSEDLVQNLFIEIWNKKLYLQIETSVKNYLFRAVKNRCYNQLKKDKVNQKKLRGYLSQNTTNRFPKWVERKELAAKINHALAELPQQRQRAFTIVYIENKKYKEAAEEMGISINSVKTHLRLALKLLRKRLKPFS